MEEEVASITAIQKSFKKKNNFFSYVEKITFVVHPAISKKIKLIFEPNNAISDVSLLSIQQFSKSQT